MLSAHGSVSLQLLIVPVWSDREIPNSNCVLTVELPPPGFAVTLVHAGFKQVSLRRTTLWLQAALKKKSLKNFNIVLLKTVRYIPKKRRLYVVESFLKNFYTVSIQIRRRVIISFSPSSFSPKSNWDRSWKRTFSDSRISTTWDEESSSWWIAILPDYVRLSGCFSLFKANMFKFGRQRKMKDIS